jgi:DNA-binding transcriptional MerR regulator
MSGRVPDRAVRRAGWGHRQGAAALRPAGLFRPAWVDPESGYRYYSPAQLPQLRRIVALKDLGLTLAEVAALVDGGADLRQSLARRRHRLEEERRAVEVRLAALDIRVEMADEGPDVVVRSVHSMRVATVRTALGPGDALGPLFYEVEAAVRAVDARAPLPPGVVVERAGSGIGVEVFVPVRKGVESGRVRTRRLPAIRAACVLSRGPYGGMPTVRRALERWIDGSGYQGAGPERIVYLQFGAEPELEVPAAYLADGPAEYLTEIQIPVR